MSALVTIFINVLFIRIPTAILGFVVSTSERLFAPKFWKTYPDGKSC